MDTVNFCPPAVTDRKVSKEVSQFKDCKEQNE